MPSSREDDAVLALKGGPISGVWCVEGAEALHPGTISVDNESRLALRVVLIGDDSPLVLELDSRKPPPRRTWIGHTRFGTVTLSIARKDVRFL